jgi:glutathione synthase/RimK-type ligase-like ATP-grasp enzyme
LGNGAIDDIIDLIMTRIALATAIAATGLDDDMPGLLETCARAGLGAEVLAWDDPTVSWQRFDAVLLRSTWDYTERLSQFLDWCVRVDQVSTLLNPLPVLRWNTDKHYLAELAAREVPVVPSLFVEPEMEPLPNLQAFLSDYPAAGEFVVKPAVGAGSRDTQRYARAQEFAAANHIARLLDGGRSALLQPYLPSVDHDGETALMFFDGEYSHAIRKGPLLRSGQETTDALFAAEAITPRTPGDDEQALARDVLAAMSDLLHLDAPLAYARVDLIRDTDGSPRLLELELCEPSLFFHQAPGSVERFVARLAERLAPSPPRRASAS